MGTMTRNHRNSRGEMNYRTKLCQFQGVKKERNSLSRGLREENCGNVLLVQLLCCLDRAHPWDVAEKDKSSKRTDPYRIDIRSLTRSRTQSPTHTPQRITSILFRRSPHFLNVFRRSPHFWNVFRRSPHFWHVFRRSPHFLHVFRRSPHFWHVVRRSPHFWLELDSRAISPHVPHTTSSTSSLSRDQNINFLQLDCRGWQSSW